MTYTDQQVGRPIWAFDTENNPYPKAIPLPQDMNRFAKYGVVITPISLYGATIPNVKVGMARYMFEAAKQAGRLEGVHAIVEASSGNTIVGIKMVGPDYGDFEYIPVVEPDIAQGKLEQLRMVGLLSVAYPFSGKSTIETARMIGERPGHLNLNQYASEYNWKAHVVQTGSHVMRQTDGRKRILAVAMGTTGTIKGVTMSLRMSNIEVTSIGAVCAPNNPIPGVRTLESIRRGVSIDWRTEVNHVIEVERKPAYRASKGLVQIGNMGGPSSGCAWVALDCFLKRMEDEGRLATDEFRNVDGSIDAQFLCPDPWYLYADKYSTILDGDDFS